MERVAGDAVRVAAMAMVVVIHALDTWRRVPGWPDGAGAWAAVAVDQACRACVPLFVLLSGFALARRHAPASPWPEPGFWERRVLRLAVPFALWSLLGLGVALAAHPQAPGAAAWAAALGRQGDEPAWWAAVRWVLTGAADYHLYFLPIILACSALFPLAARHRPGPWAIAWLLAWLIGISLWQSGSRLWGWWYPHLWSTVPVAWAAWFLIGVWLADHGDALAARIRTWPGWAVVALAASGPGACLAEFAALAGRMPNDWHAGFDRISVVWSVAMAWLAALRWGPALARLPAAALSALTAMAAASFAIYLLHTWVLRGLDGLGGAGLPWPLRAAVALAAACAAGWLLHQAGQRWRAVGWWIGR